MCLAAGLAALRDLLITPLNCRLAARTAARSLLCACHRRGKGMRCTGCTVTALWQFFTQPPGGEAAPVLQLRTIRVPSLRGGFG